jgi:excisionase family DNA binding protein
MQADTHEIKLPEVAGAVPNGPTAFLTYGEFAREARLSPTTVRKHVRLGDLLALRIGRSVRIPRTELDRLVRQAMSHSVHAGAVAGEPESGKIDRSRA